MNSAPPEDHFTVPVRVRLAVRQLRALAMSAGRLHSLSLLGLPLLVLPIAIALSLAKVEAGSSRPGNTKRAQSLSAPAAGQDAPINPDYRNRSKDIKYVGSEACRSCHQAEYEHYFKTPHGQAATLTIARPELKNLPPGGTVVCPDDSGHCFRVFLGKDGPGNDGPGHDRPRGDGYFMSQFDRGADGTESNVEIEKIAFALGQPLMATGYVIQRGNHLFEAPLTFYAVPGPEHIQGWALSPGYVNDTRGFNRPLTDTCLSCHLGRPSASETGVNLYKSPPFEELAIGCENCHGPGALHVKERQQHRDQSAGHPGPGTPAAAASPARYIDTSIVNPRYLTAQRADDTCISCHELGEARISQPRTSLQDYRPGDPLLKTVAIFKSKLLLGWNVEEWSDEMATSKCYRFSKGAMRCSTCHDPHTTPTAEEAPAFYRSKCLSCHQSASCTLPLAQRQHTQPVDNCITCHMAKHSAPKMVKFGGQGTSHRITKTEDEALPQADTPRTSVDPSTGLILVDSDSTDAQKHLDPVVLLKAYESIQARYHSNDFASQHQAVLQQLSLAPKDSAVFSALANAEVAKHTPEGDRSAIGDLTEAIRLNSDTPKDYMLLSELQFRAKDFAGAIAVLTSTLQRFPYLPAAYEHLAACYRDAGQPSKAAETIQRGLAVFPSDKNLHALAQQLRP